MGTNYAECIEEVASQLATEIHDGGKNGRGHPPAITAADSTGHDSAIAGRLCPDDSSPLPSPKGDTHSAGARVARFERPAMVYAQLKQTQWRPLSATGIAIPIFP